MSAGISLSIIPILYLWSHTLGWQQGEAIAWLLPIFCHNHPCLVLYSQEKKRIYLTRERSQSNRKLRFIPSKWIWHDLIYIALALTILLTRFLAIRDMEIPLWGDSLQHTMMAQLLVDHGGLFSSWLPYAQMESFTYHFGFHIGAAAFHWISHLSVIQSVLVTGQFINILAILSLYPLSVRITRKPWAGLISMAIAGLLFPMPMSYLNWGRYTQLAGLVILPVAAFLIMHVMEARSFSWRETSLVWTTLAGLALTHYRVLIFALMIFPVYIFYSIIGKGFLETIKRTGWIALGTILITLPWLINVTSGKLDLIAKSQLTTPASQLSDVARQAFGIGSLTQYLPAWAWICSLVFVIWGLWKRDKGISIITTWWLLILLVANPQWLHLPGAGIITSFAVFISTYLPVSIILSAGLCWLADAILPILQTGLSKASPLKLASHKWLAIIMIPVVMLVAYFLSQQRLQDVDPVTGALVMPQDITAAEWIKENTPADASFVINGFFNIGGASVVGSDAGWWLPLLAARQVNIPPLPYVSERGPRPDYVQWVNSLISEIAKKGIQHADVVSLLDQHGIDYVYIGQRQGTVNSPGPLLDLSQLLSSEYYEPVYHQDQVWIFKLLP